MAYVATVLLKQFIQGLQEESKYDTRVSKSKVELICEELSFLGPFLKIMRLSPRKATLDVCSESRVKNAVKKLKDVICCYTYGDDVSTLALFQQLLLQVKRETNSVSETLKTDEEYRRRERESSCNYTSTTFGFIANKKMVGLHDQLNRLKDLVLEESDENKLILVTGMTCIGKTALVQEIYKDPLVVEHFEAYLFLSFGPQYQLKEILLLALHQLGTHSDKLRENVSIQELKDYLKESLSERRCLVVLDSVWENDSAFTDLCENILSGDEMSSCVIVTTQNLRLISSYSEHIHVRFLDDNESWQLLRETIFTSDHQEQCDSQLEKIGKKIAKNCEGLPLAIIQVGELMRNIEKTVENWNEIAEKEDPLTITSDDNTPLSNALCLSYNMLPECLMICFSYMGIFRKKYRISRSELIYLWVSEGLVKKSKDNIVEETAGEYLDELVSQSCVLREEQRSISMSGTKTCRLHFTFRSLCVSESKKQGFFHVIRKYTDICPENIDDLDWHRRLCIHNGVLLGFNQVHQWLESASRARSFLYFGPKHRYPIILNLPFRILSVLHVVDIRFYEFPHQVLDLILLKYLAITCDGELPPSISRLLGLQVLIFLKYHNIKCWKNTSPVYLPSEIWNLGKLKHLQCTGFDMPDPTSIDDGTRTLKNLLTLSGVSAHSCRRRVLARMPNLEKIGIKIESANDSVETAFSSMGDFTSLDHLVKSFKCAVMYPNILRSQLIPSNPNFPENVRKITLSGCGFPWKYTRVIGALPKLKVLKLRCYAFCGAEWEIAEIKEREQFPSLEYLLLEDLDIQRLVKNCRCFLELKCLIIRHCYKLREIPREFLWIDQIEVDSCSLSLVKQIQDRRINFQSSPDGMMIRVKPKSSPHLSN